MVLGRAAARRQGGSMEREALIELIARRESGLVTGQVVYLGGA
jgi:hypothetical protein